MLPILPKKIKYDPESWQKLTVTKSVFKGKLTKVYLDKYYRYSYICNTKPAGSLSFYQTTGTATAKVQKLRTDGAKGGRSFRVCKMKQAQSLLNLKTVFFLMTSRGRLCMHL